MCRLGSPNDAKREEPGCEQIDYDCSPTAWQVAALAVQVGGWVAEQARMRRRRGGGGDRALAHLRLSAFKHAACSPPQTHTPDPTSTWHALPCLQFALVLAYAAAYLFLLHRAFADHSQLSFCHYRLTNCYIRIMVGACMHVSCVYASRIMVGACTSQGCMGRQRCWRRLCSAVWIGRLLRAPPAWLPAPGRDTPRDTTWALPAGSSAWGTLCGTQQLHLSPPLSLSHALPLVPAFVRQSRHGVTAFFTIVVFLLLLQLVHVGSCWSYIDVALGALPIQARGDSV